VHGVRQAPPRLRLRHPYLPPSIARRHRTEGWAPAGNASRRPLPHRPRGRRGRLRAGLRGARRAPPAAEGDQGPAGAPQGARPAPRRGPGPRRGRRGGGGQGLRHLARDEASHPGPGVGGGPGPREVPGRRRAARRGQGSGAGRDPARGARDRPPRGARSPGPQALEPPPHAGRSHPHRGLRPGSLLQDPAGGGARRDPPLPRARAGEGRAPRGLPR
jgi:hypothetical protein